MKDLLQIEKLRIAWQSAERALKQADRRLKAANEERANASRDRSAKWEARIQAKNEYDAAVSAQKLE